MTDPLWLVRAIDAIQRILAAGVKVHRRVAVTEVVQFVCGDPQRHNHERVVYVVTCADPVSGRCKSAR